MIRFTAHFDGRHLSPDTPVDLPTDRPLQVTVEETPAECDVAAEDKNGLGLGKFLDCLEAKVGLFDGPADLSAELDHYLYGTSKRSRMDGP